jgi:hypothetical protein
MRIPLRLGAIVTLGALLLVGMLASPALAWKWGVSGEPVCENDGTITVNWTVEWAPQDEPEGSEGALTVTLRTVGGEDVEGVEPQTGTLTADEPTASGAFTNVPADLGSVVVHAEVVWTGKEHAEERDSKEIQLPTDCEAPPPTPSTAPPTPTSAVAGATSTTAGENVLPFTGNSSGPMLLASIGLVGGGFLILLVSRTRGRHAAK